MAKKKSVKANELNKEQVFAIVGIIINAFLLPGLGTIIAGQVRTGIWQIILFFIGVLLAILLIGIPLIIGAWVWSIITTVLILRKVI